MPCGKVVLNCAWYAIQHAHTGNLGSYDVRLNYLTAVLVEFCTPSLLWSLQTRVKVTVPSWHTPQPPHLHFLRISQEQSVQGENVALTCWRNLHLFHKGYFRLAESKKLSNRYAQPVLLSVHPFSNLKKKTWTSSFLNNTRHILDSILHIRLHGTTIIVDCSNTVSLNQYYMFVRIFSTCSAVLWKHISIHQKQLLLYILMLQLIF